MAQDSSLMDILGDEPVSRPLFETATFKTTRVLSGHSVETVYDGLLELRIAHRFGAVNRGAYDLFGLDQASMKFNFDYGFFPWLTAGVGRSNLEKTYDGFVKIKLLRQRTDNKMPVSVVAVSGSSVSTLRWDNADRNNLFSSRFSYFHQLLIARKFSEKLSVQLSPTLLHRNLIADNRLEKNDVYSLGLGLRQKISKRTSINAEYFFNQPGSVRKEYHNAFSIGFDLETGGHVFQLHFTNSTAMNEKSFLAENVDDWLKGGIHFGFNVSRVFTIKDNR
jgi:hypothetical protein